MNSVYLLLKIAGIDSDFNNKVFVPLIPDYRVYTKLGETYFRFDIEWCNKENTILYQWNDFANDFTFTNVQHSHVANDNLTSLRSHIKDTSRIKYSGTISVPFLLGLTCKENVVWLRGFISQHISNFFQLERTLFHAECQRNNILNQAKRKAKEL